MSKPKDKKCFLVTCEVDYEQPDIIKGFGCQDDAEAFRSELEAYQRAKPAWPNNDAPNDEFVRIEKSREDWCDAHPAGRGAVGADRFGIIAAPFVPDPAVVDLPAFDGYQAHIVRELQAAFVQACEKVNIKVKAP